MATLLNPFIRALDANGDPVSGAQLAVFGAGTTTPVTTYSDRALSTAQARPLIANSAGEFEQSFVASGVYKIRVSDADGVTLYENDNVRIADRPDDPVFFDTIALLLASTDTYADGTFLIAVQENARYKTLASGATDFSDENAGGQKLMRGFLAYDTVSDLLDSVEPTRGAGAIWEGGGFRYEEAASGATDQHVTTAGGVKLYVLAGEDGGYNVKAFGAIGDGSENDTTAIQKAINSAGGNSGVKVIFPIGTYNIDSVIRLKRETVLKGAGRAITTIVQTSDVSAFEMNETTDGQLVYGIVIEDLTIEKESKTSTADANGIWLTGTSNNVWDANITRVNIFNFYDGLRIDRPILTTIQSGYIHDNYRNGVYIGSGGTSLVVKNTFSSTNGGSGYYIEGGLYYCHFDTTASDQNSLNGYYFKELSGASPTAFTLTSCGAEFNTQDGFLFEDVESFVLSSCFSFRNTGNGYQITSGSRDISFESSKAVNNTGYGISTDSSNRGLVARGLVFSATGFSANTAGDTNENTDLAIFDNNIFISGREYWAKIPFGFADFENNFTTGDFATSASLPANAVVTECFVDLDIAFSGGSVSAATMQVGGPLSPSSSPYNQYMTAQDVFTGAAGVVSSGSPVQVPSKTSGGRIIARLICTGGNTDTLTAGEGTIYVKFTVLP